MLRECVKAVLSLNKVEGLCKGCVELEQGSGNV